MKFEIVSKYADEGLNLPVRKTAKSAGYDFEVAKDTVIPSYPKIVPFLQQYAEDMRYTHFMSTGMMLSNKYLPLEEVAAITKETSIKPTLVPTGIKCEIPDGYYLELSVRSSCPLKHWLVLANGVGVIDADYYNNSSNEGEIFFQIINLSPFDILLKKGDVIGQGILKKYYITDDDTAVGERVGGFGSTDQKFVVDKILKATVYDKNGECGTITNVKPMEEECVMACNPERRAYIFGTPKESKNG